VGGRVGAVHPARIVRAVGAVVEGGGRAVRVPVIFLGRERMRGLNARWTGRDLPTDVLAFRLPLAGGGLAGDVYVCPAVAAGEAQARRLALRQELLRLVIHGILHL